MHVNDQLAKLANDYHISFPQAVSIYHLRKYFPCVELEEYIVSYYRQHLNDVLPLRKLEEYNGIQHDSSCS